MVLQLEPPVPTQIEIMHLQTNHYHVMRHHSWGHPPSPTIPYGPLRSPTTPCRPHQLRPPPTIPFRLPSCSTASGALGIPRPSRPPDSWEHWRLYNLKTRIFEYFFPGKRAPVPRERLLSKRVTADPCRTLSAVAPRWHLLGGTLGFIACY